MGGNASTRLHFLVPQRENKVLDVLPRRRGGGGGVGGRRRPLGVLAWAPIVESRARLGGEVGGRERRGEVEGEGGHLHVITIACVGRYITGCGALGWRQTHTSTERRDVRREGGGSMLDQ